VSLDGFYRALAALASDPGLVRGIRGGESDWLLGFELSPLEVGRLEVMARHDGMEVTCSLYRSNRLTALLRTVPTLVEALGDRLGAEVTQFWIATPRTDMQFRTEGAASVRLWLDVTRIWLWWPPRPSRISSSAMTANRPVEGSTRPRP
jgi:hypothetical protein